MHQPQGQSTNPPNEYQQAYYPPPPTSAYNPQQHPQNYPDQMHDVEFGKPQQSYGQPPPNYVAPQEQSGGGEKIKPASGWNDIWAIFLWLANMGAFIGLSVVALSAYSSNRGSYNGVQSYNDYPGLTFDTSTFAIFGLAGVVGFGISFLYLIITQL
jgi:hypothetical protein